MVASWCSASAAQAPTIGGKDTTTPAVISAGPASPVARWAAGPSLYPSRSAAVVALSPPRSASPEASAAPHSSLLQASSLESPGITFEGLSNTTGRVPADPDVAASSSYVFEIAEPDFQIFSTTGAALTGPTSSASLWAPLGGACADDSSGDWSEVIYDQLADQWVYSRTVHPSVDGTIESLQCLAVSETSDPTQAYYLYATPIADGHPSDYPQFGMWPNSYTVSANLWTQSGGSGAFEGDRIVAFDRAEMLEGQTVQTQSVTLNSSYESYVPVTLEGSTLPPVGTPEFILGGPSDFQSSGSTIEMFEAQVNWTTPTESTLTGPESIPVTPYDSDVCSGTQTDACAAQPGTATKLQAWTDNLMDPVAYENFGSYQSIVGTFDVESSRGIDAMQWFELRNPGPDTTLYQQGVYEPDGTSRYDQSIGIDSAGDIALAYQASSGTLYPSLGYVGRTAADPLGTLPETEQELWAGSASQTSSTPGLGGGGASRWGDASYLAVSPDGCTFWYAGAYYPAAGSEWQTEIGSFQFSDCTPTSATGAAAP